jgi:quercetin dioxygenase-like cupin family protein
MNFRSCVQLLPGLLFILASCNNETKTAGVSETSTSQESNTSTGRTPAYDTSRSVTTISPNLYKVLADTLNIRMLEGVYKPGDSSIMHAHPDFALYVLEGSTVELTAMNGNKQNIEFKKDMAIVLPADNHSAKNIGNSTLRLIVVEVNRPAE